MSSGHLKLPLFNFKALLWSLKAETHRGIQLELSSKSNNSILVEWHHKPLSKVNGVPIERTFYHRKWTLKPIFHQNAKYLALGAGIGQCP